MKKTVVTVCALLLVAAGITRASAAEMKHESAAKTTSAFETLKTLEGTWTGKAGAAGGATEDATVVYKVTGAGSALEERLFPGTPHEMVTMYHLDGDSVVLTHYCAAGNQPRMKLAANDGKSFEFKFAGGTNLKSGDKHMHDAKIVVVDSNHIRAEWTAWDAGKPEPAMVFELARKP